MKRPRFGPQHLLPLIALIAACGGQSCTCLGPIPGGFPTDSRRHENAMQVRVTGDALTYLQMNGKALVTSLLPNGQKFPIPASCTGKNKVCCGNPQPTCEIDLDIKNVGLNTSPPNTLKFTVTTALTTPMAFPVEFDTGLLGTAKCTVAIDTTKSNTQFKTVDLTGDVQFAVDATTDLTNITLANTTIKNLDQSMLTLKSQPGDFLCTVANFGPIKSFIIGQLQKQLGDQISGAADGAFCAACKSQTDCDSFADACTNGQCMRKMKCLQEIGAAGRLDLASLASMLASTGAKLDTLAVLGGYAQTPPVPANGVSLGLLGGGQAAAHNPCVPMRPAPASPMITPWTQASANVEPVANKPYHLGIGVHESHLNTMAWAAFDAGALCLNVGTPTVPQLDSKTLGILFQSLADLTHGENTPFYLAVRPAEEPHITLGAGTFDVDMMGKKTIKDPILHITIPSLSIDFYTLIEQRYNRIATLTADVALGVALDVDDKGQLVPMLSDLNGAFTNVRVSNTKLLTESPAALAKAFPALLAVAGGAIGNLSPIALPKVMGINILPVAVEPVDQMKYLGIFANLSLAAPEAFHAETTAEVLEVLAPPTERFSAEGGMDPREQVRVMVALDGAGRGGDARDLEWSARLDDGFWTPYQPGRTLEFTDPRLWLQGRHALDIRARVAGEPATTDPTPTRVEFLVDTVAPSGTFDIAGDELVFTAKDFVSPPEALEFSYRLPGAEWSPWARGGHVLVDGRLVDPFASDLGARARDEAGNVGQLDFHGRMTTPAGGGGCGCHVGSAPHAHPERGLALFVMALLGFTLFVRRNKDMLQRNKRYLPAAAIAALAACGLLAACNQDVQELKLGKDQLLDPTDEIGRYSDAVAQGGVIRISAYDDTNGDLAYAEVKTADVGGATPIEWQWVDGVPAAAAAPTPDTYRRGTNEAGDDVGLYTSIAVTASGEARIAYYDATNKALRYASATSRREWTAYTVDQPATGGRAGLYASLSLDKSDLPSIAYMVTDLPDGKGGFVSKLRVASAKIANPATAADWNFVDVDSTAIPCAGLCKKTEACVPTDANAPWKSTCKTVDAMPCPAMCGASQACIAAACVTIQTPSKVVDLPEGTGLFASMRRLPSGQRAIVYHDRVQGDLKLAAESAPGMFMVSVLDGNDPTTDVGQFASAAISADGTLHVAYVDAIFDRLLYKTVKAGVVSAMPEVIDDGMRSDGPHPVGAGVSLWTDGNAVKAAYQDQRAVELWGATRGGMAWSKGALKSGNAGHGYYPHLVSDGGKVYVTQFSYDRAAVMNSQAFGALSVSALP